MKRFIEGEDRKQATLLPECLDDFIAEDNPARIIEAFVEELELESLGFEGATPSTTGRPSYDPAVLLKIYIYGYLNRVQSSRRLERECQRNIELMWLTGRLAPDFKTIADFRKDNGAGIRNVCRRFVVLCRDLKLFTQALVAIDGSKFRAVNTRDRNFTSGKVDKRQQQIEESIQRYLSALSPARRRALLEWAATRGAWIIEDDYLGELQLDGRAAPALAAGEGAERVVHIGAFSKTISPALGLGFVVAPRAVAERLVEVCAVLAPAPNRTTQLAVTEFLRDGHYLRHLRQMKALYGERRRLPLAHVSEFLPGTLMAGLGVIAPLPQTADDRVVVGIARARGLAPSALSAWYLRRNHAQGGLLLSATNLRPDNIEAVCATLAGIVASSSRSPHESNGREGGVGASTF